MKSSVVGQLIRKDLQLHMQLLLICTIIGLGALAVSQIGGEGPFVVGSVVFFVAIIVVGCMLPVSTIINERKKQTLTFVMSLPVSAIQYTLSKLVSSMSLFLIPWFTLVVAATTVIGVRHAAPHGMIPFTLILCLLPLIGFTLILAFAIVGESETWSMVATVFCNSSYSLTWYFLARFSSVMNDLKSPVAIWSRQALTLLGFEILLIPIILGVTFYLQSRKRDFV